MKFTSRYALAAALGFSVATVGAVTPALAAKKQEATADNAPKLSDAMRKALIPAQEAMAKKDQAAADAAIAQARTVAKTPDEQYTVAQFGLNAAQMSGDQARLSTALDEFLATGIAANKLSDAEKAKFYGFQGMFAYQAKNYAKSEQAYSAAIAAGSANTQDYAILADSQSHNGKAVEALATLQKLIDQTKASGGTIPNEYYARGADIAQRGKLTDQFVGITSAWLSAYPQKQNWHDSLIIYRQMSNSSGDSDIDLLRLARASGILPLAAQNTYLDYALAVYLKYPGEAVSVLNEGIKAGKLNPSTSKNTAEVLALSQPKIGPDKASLPASIKAASDAKTTYKSAEITGDVLYGYDMFKQAADVYKIALTKPGADTNQGNLRLGAALAQAGDKEAARAAFAAVKSGPYKVLAAYWTVLIDHPAQ